MKSNSKKQGNQIVKQINAEQELKQKAEKTAEKIYPKSLPIDPITVELQDLLFRLIKKDLIVTAKFVNSALAAMGWELTGDRIMAEKMAFKEVGVKEVGLPSMHLMERFYFVINKGLL